MYYQAGIALLLTGFLINLLLNLRTFAKLEGREVEIPDPAPLISILVPTRNEAANIATCLDSLRRQVYPNFEILVLDDSSSDNTADIVEGIAARDSRVRLVRGKPLPQGWTGKTFACHQLAAEAKGDWLLFTDADTVHSPMTLSNALNHALKNRLSLVSGWPLQVCRSPSQRIVVPVFIFILMSWFPLWWFQHSSRPKLGLTVGQFLLFDAQDYGEIGGHEAVKSRILEDMWLGANIVRHGKRQQALDLSPVISTRMYQRTGDLWEGFTKWVYSIACLSPLGLGLLMVAGFCSFVGPFLWLLWHFISGHAASFTYLPLLVVQATIILLMRAVVDQRFRHSKLYSITHPLGISFLLFSCGYAAIKRMTGTGVSWKGRLYQPDSDVQ